MPSAFILSVRSYPAVPRAGQLAHQRYVPPNPLVLGRKLLKSPTPTTDRDRPVSRRSKPSSRTAFIGEQPNPWELLHPQDAMHVIPRFPVAQTISSSDPDPDRRSACDGILGQKTISDVLDAYHVVRSSVVTGSKELVLHVLGHERPHQIAELLKLRLGDINAGSFGCKVESCCQPEI